jgi:NodT family efflux transporter outer membrane factor (OMF) lipoprotein
MNDRLAICMFSAGALLSSCVDVSSPPEEREPLIVHTREAFVGAPTEASGAAEQGWIAAFGDDRLQALVVEALEQNADLAGAAARVERAFALARRASAALKPTVEAGGDAGRSDVGIGASALYDVGLRASWEVDVWGRLSDAQRAAALDAEAARADFAGARNALAAETAREWFVALAARERVAIDERSLAQRERVERITKARFDAGEAAAADADLAGGTRAAAAALAEQSRGARKNAALALETLLGRYPANELAPEGNLPDVGAHTPVGLPSELLERRPDVTAARCAVRASFERVSAAEKARLPHLALTGQAGFASDELSGLVDESNLVWTLAGGIVGPLFDGGRLLAESDVARAERSAALANWVAIARGAFLEVERALNDEATLRGLARSLDEAVERLTRARTAAEERYAEGEATLLQLDQIHEQLYQVERSRLDARLGLVLARVRLFLALGGSFDVKS